MAGIVLQLKNRSDRLKSQIKDFFDFKTTLLFLLIFCFCFCIFFFYLPKALPRTLSRSMANAVVIFLLVRLAHPLRIPAILYVSFVVTLNVSCIYLYGGVLHDGMLASVMETHYSEAKEFLFHAGILPWLLFLAIFGFLLRLTRNISKTGIVGIAVLLVLLLFPLLKVAVPSWLGLSMREAYEFRQYPMEIMGSKYRTYLVTKEPAMIAGYHAAQSKINDALSKTRILPVGITLDSVMAKSAPKRIVIILGESDHKKHHGIYGYPYPTDYFMMKMREAEKDKVAIFNAVSPASVTREAVIRMFSLATAKRIEPFTDNVSLLEMASAAGYETLWLSKQGGIGLHDTLVRVIALQADRVSFVAGKFDDTLLKPFSDNLRVCLAFARESSWV